MFSIRIIRLCVKAGSTNTTLDLDLWVGGRQKNLHGDVLQPFGQKRKEKKKKKREAITIK